MKMNPVVHFEMPYIDKERMADFYAKSFGWKTNFLGEDMGNYVVVMTAEKEKTPGVINGGFYPKDESKPEQHPSFVIAVDDIQEAMDKIEKAGGEILGEPMDIPGVGPYVSFMDTEGNRVSILKPTGNM